MIWKNKKHFKGRDKGEDRSSQKEKSVRTKDWKPKN